MPGLGAERLRITEQRAACLKARFRCLGINRMLQFDAGSDHRFVSPFRFCGHRCQQADRHRQPEDGRSLGRCYGGWLPSALPGHSPRRVRAPQHCRLDRSGGLSGRSSRPVSSMHRWSPARGAGGLSVGHRRRRRPNVHPGEGETIAPSYERKSIMISSNLLFSDWDKIFKDPMTTAAAIDRIVHHSTILELDGESQRIPAAKKPKGGG